MRLANILNITVLVAAQTAGAAPTQQDIEDLEAPDVTVPRSEIVTPVLPGGDGPDAGPEARSQIDPVPDPSREMLNDVQAVIASVRSKTPMPDQPLSHLDTTEEVHVLRVSELPGQDAYHALPLDEALRENRSIIAAIRDQIRLNIFAIRALDAEGFTAGDVLTWETAGTDDVTIVVDDSSSDG